MGYACAIDHGLGYGSTAWRTLQVDIIIIVTSLGMQKVTTTALGLGGIVCPHY